MINMHFGVHGTAPGIDLLFTLMDPAITAGEAISPEDQPPERGGSIVAAVGLRLAFEACIKFGGMPATAQYAHNVMRTAI